jgi:prepilin-type N-terminal cleavage/methylation domain-containing protein
MRSMTTPMKRRARGYTAVEVLTAMTLFAIGAAGVIGMQRATVQGGADARRFDVATNIAHQWLFRLQRDSLYWTTPNNDDRVNTNIVNTKWLSQLATGPSCAAVSATGYCTPTIPATGSESPAADILGRDVGAAPPAEHFFCTQFRLRWIADPRAAPQCSAAPTDEPCITALARVEVRVFWKRSELTPIGDCAGVDPDSSPLDYHFVYAASAVRENAGEFMK